MTINTHVKTTLKRKIVLLEWKIEAIKPRPTRYLVSIGNTPIKFFFENNRIRNSNLKTPI